MSRWESRQKLGRCRSSISKARRDRVCGDHRLPHQPRTHLCLGQTTRRKVQRLQGPESRRMGPRLCLPRRGDRRSWARSRRSAPTVRPRPPAPGLRSQRSHRALAPPPWGRRHRRGRAALVRRGQRQVRVALRGGQAGAVWCRPAKCLRFPARARSSGPRSGPTTSSARRLSRARPRAAKAVGRLLVLVRCLHFPARGRRPLSLETVLPRSLNLRCVLAVGMLCLQDSSAALQCRA
mmetsp:Transcript_60299/g.197242  ORF Transcript_60299/g.197242 Transcript_60299/m.197242 type:complete len:236 (-) Transcript_60299:284-991(-)